MNVEIPIAILHKDIMPSHELLIYAWLLKFRDMAEEDNEFNEGANLLEYKEIAELSGCSVKKVSLAVNYLERRGIINIDRKKGRVYFSIPEKMPESIQAHFESKVMRVIQNKRIKAANKKIKVAKI